MQFQQGRHHTHGARQRTNAYPSGAGTGAGAAGTGVTCEVQNAHRVAAMGMSLRHSGQARVSTSTAVSGWKRFMSRLTGLMTKKKMTAAMMRNAISALMNAP